MSKVETGLISASVDLWVHNNCLLLEVLLEIIHLLVQSLLDLSICVDDSAILWNSTSRQLLEHFVKVVLIGSGVPVEVASLLVGLVLHILGAMVVRDIREYLQSWDLRGIYVHVVDFRLLNIVQILFLSHFLLKHFGLLLVLLNTIVNAVNKYVPVDDLFLSERVRGLLISESTSASGSNHCCL